MARIRPSSLCEDMQANLQITPESSRYSRDPRMTEAYSPTYDDPPRRFPRYYQTDFAPFPDRPRPTLYSTPDSPEHGLTPRRSVTVVRSVKFQTPPKPSVPQGERTRSDYGLMYPWRHSLEDKPPLINDIHIIFASPVLQEQIHHFLYDHGITKEKIQSTLRYMGITQSAFMEFIRISYPCHYWSYIGNDDCKKE